MMILSEKELMQQTQTLCHWQNEAAAVMARFINLSATPDIKLWAETALEATRLLNAPWDAAKDNKMEIFHVYHEEEFVGSFLQATFSTREKAEYYAKNNKYKESEMTVVPYELDSHAGLGSAKGEKC